MREAVVPGFCANLCHDHGYVGYLGYLGYCKINNLCTFNASFCRALSKHRLIQSFLSAFSIHLLAFGDPGFGQETESKML
jgi:hypothetical protein